MVCGTGKMSQGWNGMLGMCIFAHDYRSDLGAFGWRQPSHAVDPLQMLQPKPANHLEMLQAKNGRGLALPHGMAGTWTAPQQVYSWLYHQ